MVNPKHCPFLLGRGMRCVYQVPCKTARHSQCELWKTALFSQSSPSSQMCVGVGGAGLSLLEITAHFF